MKNISLLFILTLLFSTASSALADDTIVRVSCKQQDIGAKIYLNKTFKGECDGSPLTIMVPAGSYTLRAHKQVDSEREQTFNKQLSLVAGVFQRVTVALSAPKLTPAAQKAHDRKERLRKEQEAKAEKLRQQKSREEEAKKQAKLAQEELKAAQGGDMAAMAAIAQRYETGNGVQQDYAKAQHWSNKRDKVKAAKAAKKDLQVAEAGNIAAMNSMARRYKQGDGVEQDTKLASTWDKKANAATEVAKQKKIAKDKRQAEAQVAKKLAEAKKNFSYTKMTDSFFKDGMKFGKDPFEGLFMTTVSPIMTGVALLLDLISTPTRITEWKKISTDITGHASAWAKPNSMIAKAYRHKWSSNTTETTLTLAAR